MLLPTAFDWHVIKDEILGMTITTLKCCKIEIAFPEIVFQEEKFNYLSTYFTTLVHFNFASKQDFTSAPIFFIGQDFPFSIGQWEYERYN